MRPLSSFLAAAQTGDLPAVSWLEPTFSDVEQAIARADAADDDLPPGDVAPASNWSSRCTTQCPMGLYGRRRCS